MWSGIGLFALAMLIAGYIYYSKIFSVDISNLSWNLIFLRLHSLILCLDSHRVVFLFPLICFALVQLLLFFPLIFPLIYLFQFAEGRICEGQIWWGRIWKGQ
jgi:hypothetical protein